MVCLILVLACMRLFAVDCRNISASCENCSLDDDDVCFQCAVGAYLNEATGSCDGELLLILRITMPKVLVHCEI